MADRQPRPSAEGPVALLYDVHGNLVALEAVLAEADAAGASSYLLGGDYAAFGPWPRETVERLELLPVLAWIRGNGERWLSDGPDRSLATNRFVRDALASARAVLSSPVVERLGALPERVELDGLLFCHGSPLSDVDSFASKPQNGEERMLAGETSRTIVFGHSHLQFRRPGPNGTDLINPGSVGMPLDGDTRAAWAVRRAAGDFEFRRTEYDVGRAVAAWRALGGDFGRFAAERLERGRD
jgi:diadenosine tetraphosphatase ApaH/serine/threonine PP2A family protein phosphatase